MANKSHFNSGHIAMNILKRNDVEHSASVESKEIEKSLHGVYIQDAVQFLKKILNNSMQLILFIIKTIMIEQYTASNITGFQVMSAKHTDVN